MHANRATTVALFAPIAALAIILTTACGLISPQQPAQPLPTPVPVHLLYESAKREHLYGHDQLKDWEGQRFPPFIGAITRIEGATVFFRVYNHDPPFLLPFSVFEKDGYIKCKLKDSDVAQTLLMGQAVVVEGVLDKAFTRGFLGMTVFGDPNSVRLKDCRLLPPAPE